MVYRMWVEAKPSLIVEPSELGYNAAPLGAAALCFIFIGSVLSVYLLMLDLLIF